MRAQWRWEFDDDAGRALARPLSPVFASRFDAEAWLGEHWRALATEAAVARLLAGDEKVGQPVPLAAMT